MRSLLILLLASPAPAAVVSFLNATDAEVTFTVEHKDSPAVAVKLPAGTTAAVRVGRDPVLRGTLAGTPVAYTLEPYTPYLFVPGDKGGVRFSGVELVGGLPKPDDVPLAPPDGMPHAIPVTLFVDAAGPLTKEAREADARATFAAAAKVLERQGGVKFDVSAVEEWQAAKSHTLTGAGDDFVEKAAVKAGRAVGFLHRAVPGDGFAAAVSSSHLLLRAGSPKAEADRVEVLVHHLGGWLGAARSPDGGSVMRTKLADGKTVGDAWVTQFDPLNLIVMHVWAEELAAGRKAKADDFGPKARERLRVLYATIAAVHDAAKSNDTQARDLAAQLAGPAVAVAEPEKPEPVVIDTVVRTDDEKAIRAVVRAVAAKAKELSKKPPAGDALTGEYVKAAAAAAGTLDESRRPRAFLVGLGIALDDSTVLRDKPVLKKLCEAVETDDERAARVAVLGRPTAHGRRDLCQHWAVSAALAEVFGETAAEFAGLAKELADSKTPSGFSFADLAADYAGIDFAAAVNAEPKRLAAVADKFAVADVVPDPKGFAEDLSEAKLKKEYGGPGDARFKKAVDGAKAAVAALPTYKK